MAKRSCAPIWNSEKNSEGCRTNQNGCWKVEIIKKNWKAVVLFFLAFILQTLMKQMDFSLSLSCVSALPSE
jgi:hypothetical protein